MADATPRIIETNPKALLNFARQYFKAAEAVFEKDPFLRLPLNYLYFHTVELLLKAFLLATGKEPERNHEIVALLGEARALGLVIPGDPGIQSIVNLLTSGNTDHAFRYGTSKSTTEPDLTWTREAVGKLLEVVSTFVDPDDTLKTPGPAIALRVTFGKPIRKSAPK
jgi:HEPN domain-containing protein